MKKRTLCGTLLVVVLTMQLAGAGIVYNADSNAVWVTDFPEESPATMDTVMAADRENGWGKVSYDTPTDTYTLQAALWIGDDKSPGTFFQIGRPDHKRENVVVHGTVWVCPPRESIKRPDGLYSMINRLTLGDPDDDTISATLKIACDQPAEHGVYVGLRSKLPGVPSQRRGDLHVYHSTITAALQDPQHRMGTKDYRDTLNPGWYGSDIRLINATISWGVNTYGMTMNNSTVRGTTFEHSSMALGNGHHFVADCVFRHLRVALSDGGGLQATVVNSVFENNEQNFTLNGHSARGITLIDCTLGPQEKPLHLLKNDISHHQILQGVPVYPAVVERRTLQVRVNDTKGNPVPDAIVTVVCDEDSDQVTGGACFTDGKGLTPPRGTDHAILITEKSTEATDDPDQHRIVTYSYRVRAWKTGYKAGTRTVDTQTKVPECLRVQLEKK